MANCGVSSGEVASGKMGGDRRSPRIEAHADFILAQIKDRLGRSFLAYVEQVLASTLRPGEIVALATPARRQRLA